MARSSKPVHRPDVALSPDAVAVLRFEIKRYRSKAQEKRLPAYRELATAGIMEPVPGKESEYRFTDEGMKQREALLEREAERIERERYATPDANLSGMARERLRRYLRGDQEVTAANHPAYRELVASPVMIPVHTFVGGREAEYRFTYWGHKLRFELAGMAGAKETA